MERVEWVSVLCPQQALFHWLQNIYGTIFWWPSSEKSILTSHHLSQGFKPFSISIKLCAERYFDYTTSMALSYQVPYDNNKPWVGIKQSVCHISRPLLWNTFPLHLDFPALISSLPDTSSVASINIFLMALSNETLILVHPIKSQHLKNRPITSMKYSSKTYVAEEHSCHGKQSSSSKEFQTTTAYFGVEDFHFFL